MSTVKNVLDMYVQPHAILWQWGRIFWWVDPVKSVQPDRYKWKATYLYLTSPHVFDNANSFIIVHRSVNNSVQAEYVCFSPIECLKCRLRLFTSFNTNRRLRFNLMAVVLHSSPATSDLAPPVWFKGTPLTTDTSRGPTVEISTSTRPQWRFAIC